jgi:hypothetical protein
LVGKILPSLFPGIWYYEESCIALEHDGEIVCVVSPDGSEGLLRIANLYTQLKYSLCFIMNTVVLSVVYEIYKVFITLNAFISDKTCGI